MPIENHLYETKQFMYRFELKGYPSFVLEHDGNYTKISHKPFYGNPSGFVMAIRDIYCP